MFIHEKAIVEPGAVVGAGTRVWAFAHILPGATIGQDCNICDHVFIENKVVVGDHVTIKSGIYIWDGVRIEDWVFLGPNVVFTNDIAPRSQRHLPEYPETRVCRGASVGANTTILPGLTIGTWAMVGAASVVTHDVPPFALVMGTPARQYGHVCVCSRRFKLTRTRKPIRCVCGREYVYKNRVLQLLGSADPDW